MNGSDVDLKALQQQAAEKKRLEAKLRELHAQQEALETQTKELEQAKLDEQADVDRLEGRAWRLFLQRGGKPGPEAGQGAAGGLCGPDEV